MGIEAEGVDLGQSWRHEWLELYNPTGNTVQLSGWTVELYRGEELYFVIPLEGAIAPNGYVVAGASSAIFNVDINYANLGGKFVNDGMRVVLSHGTSIVDEVDALSGWPAGDNTSKRTMEKIENGWQTSLSSGGTPGTENSSGLAEALATLDEKSPEGLFSGITAVPLAGALVLALGSAAALVLVRRVLTPQS